MTGNIVNDSLAGKVVRSAVRLVFQIASALIVMIVGFFFGLDYFNASWYYKVPMLLLGLGIGTYLYYLLFGAGVYKVKILSEESDSNRIRFSFEATIYRMLDHRILVAELPEGLVLTEGQIQILMFKQTTRAQLREIVDFMATYGEPVSKEYTFRGKRFLVDFHPEHNFE